MSKQSKKKNEKKSTARGHVASNVASLWLLRLLLKGGTLERVVRSWAVGADDFVRAFSLATRGMPTRSFLAGELKRLEKRRPHREGVLFANVELLGKRLGLSRLERDLVVVATLMQVEDLWSESFKALGLLSTPRLTRVLSTVLEAEPRNVRAALHREGRLTQTGLVVRSTRSACYGTPLTATPILSRLAWDDYESFEALSRLWFSKSEPAALGPEDYAHLAEELGVLEPLLTGALRARSSGVNVLVHGEPGTGKTELARALGPSLGADLFEVLVDPERDVAAGRLGAYRVAQAILREGGNALVLFDEVEDVFPTTEQSGGDHRGRPTKADMVTMLEKNPVPTIWISNSVRQIDPAFRRRFDFVLELRRPPRAVRRRIVEKYAAPLGVRGEWMDRVASDERLQPAHVQRAVRVASMVRDVRPPEHAAVETCLDRVLESQCAILFQGKRKRLLGDSACAYDLSLVNSSTDLEETVAGLSRRRAGTLCLHGNPGTGKTAFAAHLAERLGMPLSARRASDLMSCWVGDTEKRIAEMFEDARREGSVLLLDEADTFLQDRSTAVRSWEVSQVNELLVQMEAFDGIFVCATNRLEALDPASLRRFALKIRFDPLTASQRRRMFEAATGTSLCEARARSLDALEGLTAGDFAAAARRLTLLGREADAASLLQSLREEREVRTGPAGRMGFRPQAPARRA